MVIALRNIRLLACPGDVAKLTISLATVAMPGSAQVPVEGVPKTGSEGMKGNAHDNDRPSRYFGADGKTLLSEDEEVSAGAPATDFGSPSAPRKTRSRKSVKKKNFDALGRHLSPAHLSVPPICRVWRVPPDPPCDGLFFSISSSECGCHYQSALRAVG